MLNVPRRSNDIKAVITLHLSFEKKGCLGVRPNSLRWPGRYKPISPNGQSVLRLVDTDTVVESAFPLMKIAIKELATNRLGSIGRNGQNCQLVLIEIS